MLILNTIMKDNFLQVTTCHSGLYCRLVVIIVIEKLNFYDYFLSTAISC